MSEELQQLKPDFSEAMDFTPFPDQTLVCSIEDISAFRSKGAGGKAPIVMVKVRFNIDQDFKFKNELGEEVSGKGRKLFRNFPAEGQGAGFLKSFLISLKYDPKKFQLPGSKLELLGKKILVTTKLDSSQSPAVNKPDSFAPAK